MNRHQRSDTEQSPNDPQSTSAFNNSHIKNEGKIITNVGNFNYSSKRGEESGSMLPYELCSYAFRLGKEMLQEHVIDNAMHTGEVGAEELKCHKDTRIAILDDLILWVENPQRGRGIAWILGPAGVGKSAVAKTVADKLDRKGSKAIVAGSYFFFRFDPRRNTLVGFVPTLAYRLLVSMGDIGIEIEKVIENDPRIFHADIMVQWKKLIYEPVMAVNSSRSLPPAVVIIDGLDECGNEQDQRKVLELVASCGSDFPLAFIIASRPEPPISNSFQALPLADLCRPQIDLGLLRDTKEMRLYLRSSFSSIYSKYRDVLQDYAVDGSWPSDDVVDLIAKRADGQYIYPATLLRFIDQDDVHPNDRLEACLEQTPEALSPLDALYKYIMRSSHHPSNQTDDQIQTLLFMILRTRLPNTLTGIQRGGGGAYEEESTSSDNEPDAQRPLELRMMATALGLNTSQCRFKLRKLHSVLAIPSNAADSIVIHHQSFDDFLSSPRRAHPYHVDTGAYVSNVIGGCLSVIEGTGAGLNTRTAASIWWKCAKYLSYGGCRLGLQQPLIERLIHFDFDACLEHLSPRCKPEYLAFGLYCHARGYSALSEKYYRSIFTDSTVAKWLQSHWDWPDNDTRNQYTSSRASSHGGSHPLSWKAFLALGKAYSMIWEGHDNPGNVFENLKNGLRADDLLEASLAVFTYVGLFEMLSSSDIEYLSTWSRPWKFHR
ncbi:hypothetical protein AX16_000203 [Volvariella volvacea WC 439]|nr:hypothetical protein AX16_000203 [Volvariella volvacea WC 439]